jgi:hypothetical protein
MSRAGGRTVVMILARGATGGAVEILEYLHARLDLHFSDLRDRRLQLDPASPVFALEHDLNAVDLNLLRTSVREAVRPGLGARARRWWLPFVVYAAEVGYDYVGIEYWPPFEEQTSGWRVPADRSWLKEKFKQFATEYGGAQPTGAFARTFNIIAWPITHAVLPIYLQRQLAQLLFEFKRGLTTELLEDPDALGSKLASRTYGYPDRFRIFCDNASLLGQVAAALLSGEDEESPYLVRSTLLRLVDSLSQERQSQAWLHDARKSASQVRSRGLRQTRSGTSGASGSVRLPASTDPKLVLRREAGVWTASAVLPDLTALRERLPHLYEELSEARGIVSGAAGGPLARGRLVFPGQEVCFASWPAPDAPFIQLARGSATINSLIADQCRVSPGPWWVFRCAVGAPAGEVKGKFVRSGVRYVLVARVGTPPPQVPWIVEAQIATEGVMAYEAQVPAILGEADTAGLATAGIGVITDVSVRPVGLVPSSWDGEGTAEWLVGEPAMIGIRSDRAPEKCVITIEGDVAVFPWPTGESDLFVAIEGLAVGSHELSVTVFGGQTERALAAGTLVATILDPQSRPEGASAGEGLRLRAAPARPSLSDLWDDRAVLSIDGPPQTRADLCLSLRGADGQVLRRLSRGVTLPMTSGAWIDFVGRQVRVTFASTYDEAESCEVSVSKAGIGFASLVCERGFRGLRWVLVRRHAGDHAARLIDRTDGGQTSLTLFSVESPLSPVPQPLGSEITVPARGALLMATAGQSTASIIVLPDANELRRIGNVQPNVPMGPPSVSEVVRLIGHHRDWLKADLPADLFAKRQQVLVLDAITSALASLVCGHHWWRLERKLPGNEVDLLDEMQDMIGDSNPQRELARGISSRLWSWTASDETLRMGFAHVIEKFARDSGIQDPEKAAEVLVDLAGSPGRLADGDAAERDEILQAILRSPMLLRAARFAVVGTDAVRP